MPLVYSRKRLRPGSTPSIPSSDSLSPPRSEISPRPKRRRKLVQMHIDVGQRDIAHTTCPICQMVYSRGEPSDMRAHRVHHAAHVRKHIPPIAHQGLTRVEERDPGVFMVARKTLERWAKGVDQWVGGGLGGTTGAFSGVWVVVVYVEQKRVRGYLYGERVGRVREEGGEEKTGGFCGVARVWVDEDWRRKGLGEGLVEVCRKELEYGWVFQKSDVAWGGGLTFGGERLAKKWARKGGGKVWMYGRKED